MSRLDRFSADWLARVFLLWLGLHATVPATAQAQVVSEYGMKAVLFYRLSQFVYWPAGEKAPSPLILCVVGKNPFGPAINQLSQDGANIEVRLAPGDPTACHLLFISRSEAGNLESWLNRTDGKRIVTVSDIAGFARAGGMIELPVEGERVSIVINRRTAQKKGFEFNAQLLRLARVIEP
ncbi:YfiR family protein [Azonexus sp. IMCC34842]|uniref:YfiR family protein n=1 Tax=Azonexus sp. IMCC34842 TaxID=3420950 RepID=UPI003D15230E